MTHFIFKSSKRLIKNEPILSTILNQLKIVQSQNRFLRQDLVDVNGKLDRILVDKHLQMQVDEYFDKDNEQLHPEEQADLD